MQFELIFHCSNQLFHLNKNDEKEKEKFSFFFPNNILKLKDVIKSTNYKRKCVIEGVYIHSW